MKKIRFVLYSLLILGGTFLMGCSKKEENTIPVQVYEEPVYEWGNISGETITVWGDKGDIARPYMIRSFERYEELTGNTIKVVGLSKKEMNERVPKAFNSDTMEKPDILLSYGGTNVENLNPEENFYDFTEAPWIEDLTDTSLTQAVFNGKIVGLPHGEASISGTLYNKKIFEKYKIEVPTTQEEFLEVCKVLLKNGVTPVYLPYAESTMLLYQFPMDEVLKDQTILDGLNEGELSYSDIPEMKKIVEWYKIMSDSGYFGEDYFENDWNGMSKALESEEYAMMLCWDTWLYTVFEGDAKDYGLMPAFMGVPENGCFEGANVLLCLVNKNSKRKDVSLDLITFMADPYNYNIDYAGVYTAPVYNNQIGSITTPQYIEIERLVDRLYNDSTVWSRVRGFSQIDASYIQDYMENKCTLEECIESMDNARRKKAGIERKTTLK